MSCRIGMSTDPWGRIDDWKKKGYSSGIILATNLTYDEAQLREELEANMCGSHCIQVPGGRRIAGSGYSVYRVDS